MSWSLITVGTDTDWLLSSAFSRRWNTDRFMECFPVSCDVAGEVEGSGPLQKQSRVSSRTRRQHVGFSTEHPLCSARGSHTRLSSESKNRKRSLHSADGTGTGTGPPAHRLSLSVPVHRLSLSVPVTFPATFSNSNCYRADFKVCPSVLFNIYILFNTDDFSTSKHVK